MNTDSTAEAKPTEAEIERRNRIRLAVWAYAYEIKAEHLVDDATYDKVSLSIRPDLKTGHTVLDAFFENEFSPDTGLWIYRHPEFDKVASYYKYLKRIKAC